MQAKTKTLNGIRELKNLEKISVSYCRNLHNVDALSSCPKLKTVLLKKCAKLLNINLASNSLERLTLDRVTDLKF